MQPLRFCGTRRFGVGSNVSGGARRIVINGSYKEDSRREFLSASAGSTVASMLVRPAFSLAHEAFFGRAA
jgi:hypothetical protein